MKKWFQKLSKTKKIISVVVCAVVVVALVSGISYKVWYDNLDIYTKLEMKLKDNGYKDEAGDKKKDKSEEYYYTKGDFYFTFEKAEKNKKYNQIMYSPKNKLYVAYALNGSEIFYNLYCTVDFSTGKETHCDLDNESNIVKGRKAIIKELKHLGFDLSDFKNAK